MFQLDLTLRFGHSAPSTTNVGSCWYDLNKEWQGLVQRNLVPHFVKNMLSKKDKNNMIQSKRALMNLSVVTLPVYNVNLLR